jgi:hypothetical protein
MMNTSGYGQPMMHGAMQTQQMMQQQPQPQPPPQHQIPPQQQQPPQQPQQHPAQQQDDLGIKMKRSFAAFDTSLKVQ